MRTYTVATDVAGRFSELTPVTLVPLSLLGYDIASYIAGAEEMFIRCVQGPAEEDIALKSAVALFTARREGRRILETYWFSPTLEALGKWHRQLLAETCGKNGTGITPAVAIASTDFHSTLQLSLGGPADKVTRFVSIRGGERGTRVPRERVFPGVLPELAGGLSFEQVRRALRESVAASYRGAMRPIIEVEIPDASIQSIASFLMFSMLETYYLATLLRVPPLTQPDVEAYKRGTRDRLVEEPVD